MLNRNDFRTLFLSVICLRGISIQNCMINLIVIKKVENKRSITVNRYANMGVRQVKFLEKVFFNITIPRMRLIVLVGVI
ncbi:hypothetical protein SAMN05192532_102107 [Alteribacillus iranensis]|uniref:Uncharacterized protein n=1 Tax=Alteribacillus iranensis TaxID=930128 RepID=A0A1I2B6M2_9BACI|nr:hypothetical protein SAMN05192532_102107 [Alteribacillus iranensis]